MQVFDLGQIQRSQNILAIALRIYVLDILVESVNSSFILHSLLFFNNKDSLAKILISPPSPELKKSKLVLEELMSESVILIDPLIKLISILPPLLMSEEISTEKLEVLLLPVIVKLARPR